MDIISPENTEEAPNSSALGALDLTTLSHHWLPGEGQPTHYANMLNCSDGSGNEAIGYNEMMGALVAVVEFYRG